MPGTMNFRVVDAMLSVTDKQCFDMCLRLSREEGLLTGGSSGLNMHAAVELSGRCNPGAAIVVVLPDSGIKYLSKIYSPEWRQSNGFEDDPVADDTTNGTNGTSTPARTITAAGFPFNSSFFVSLFTNALTTRYVNVVINALSFSLLILGVYL